jgi:hypothetical protein
MYGRQDKFSATFTRCYSELTLDDVVIAIGVSLHRVAGVKEDDPHSGRTGQTRKRPRRTGFDDGDIISDLVPTMVRTSRGDEGVASISLVLSLPVDR